MIFLRATLISICIYREQRTTKYKDSAVMHDTDFQVTSAINIRVTSHLLNYWEKWWTRELEKLKNINGSTSIQLSWLTDEVSS